VVCAPKLGERQEWCVREKRGKKTPRTEKGRVAHKAQEKIVTRGLFGKQRETAKKERVTPEKVTKKNMTRGPGPLKDESKSLCGRGGQRGEKKKWGQVASMPTDLRTK